MRTAFKEWAIVVDALGRGDQIVILRKGGIAEGTGGFAVAQREFWLLPTRFHQRGDRVMPAAQARFAEVLAALPPPETVRLELLAEVVAWRKLTSRADVLRLRGKHVWRDEVIAERFDWGGEEAIFALAVRVQRLARPVELPFRPDYGGCKSWVELADDVSVAGASPVLRDANFARRLAAFQAALESSA
jgi:hypothetical protein